MRNLLTLFFIALMIPVFGQTKADYIQCLELMFSHSKFEAAYNNSYDINGGFVITSNQRAFFQNNTPAFLQIQQSLAPDDFYDSNFIVKIVRKDDLERLAIPEWSILDVRPSGNDTEIFFQAYTTIRDEYVHNRYLFKFEKTEKEWEVTSAEVTKIRG